MRDFIRATLNPPHSDIDRRTFLKVVSLGTAGFAIGCAPETSDTPRSAEPAETPASAATELRDMNAFVRVGTDNTVTVMIKHLDKGQGVTTGLPTIVAEEMDAEWPQMRFEFAPADNTRYANTLFGIQGTGGSTSVANSWDQLRKAGAAARAMLVEAASRNWNVPAGEISVARGVIEHPPSSRKARFGELALQAANIEPPAEPRLKSPDEFVLIGTQIPRMDSVSKTDGSAEFTIDVQRPEMRVALVAHAPKFGATVASFDAADARAITGVVDVVQIPSGVAVVADGYHAASKGRAALKIDWDFSGAETRGSAELLADHRALLSRDGLVARNDGNAPEAITGAARQVSMDFEFPYLAHATLEPMDCVVELGADRCDLWYGAQLHTGDQMAVAAITGLDLEQVHIHTRFAGGSFGRRAAPDSDYVAEAVSIAKALDGRFPIKLQWAREDDMGAGFYRPMAVHRVRAGLDGDGNIVGWDQRIVTQSILSDTPFEATIVDGIDSSSVEGASTLPYAIPNLRVDVHNIEAGVPVLWWRSVGHTHTAYATEVFFDRLAREANTDPFELRRALLREHPRHLRVLELAAEKAGWGRTLPDGQAMGIAVHESFRSFVAQVAQVTVADDGSFSVDKVVCAVDCGVAINPDVIRAQMEGGIGYGLSAALREAITLVDGEVSERNFDRYRPLRISEMPNIEVHIVPSNEAPTGVGEPGTPPIAPAVANALARATGTHIARLPIADQLRKA